MKRLALVLCLVTTISCAHYSTTKWTEDERVINAPIDVVWKKTMEILPTERMTLKEVDTDNYFIKAKKGDSGDNVSVKLIPREEKQTIMNLDASRRGSLDPFRTKRHMVRNIFDKIKRVSEGEPVELLEEELKEGERSIHGF